MTKEEYIQKLNEIKAEYKEKEIRTHIEYAKSNNPYKIGDIITDHYHTIKIEHWRVTSGINGIPYLVYFGIQLNKDGSPAKKQTDTTIHQINIIKP